MEGGLESEYIQTSAVANHDDYASTYNEPQIIYDGQHYDSYGNLHETHYIVEDPCYRGDHGLCYLFGNKRLQIQSNSREDFDPSVQNTVLSADFLTNLGKVV